MRKMFSKVLSLFVCVLVSDAQFEGDRCIKSGSYGVCRNINRCQSAIDDVRRRINPQICSFDNTDPIVCCLDANTAANPVATTTKSPAAISTTEYIPLEYEYETVGSTDGQCVPIPELLTLNKTGQMALDKCIEYQENYVYPCQKNHKLPNYLGRINKCHSNADELIVGGPEARLYEFRHMVMLGYGANIEDVQFLCGGTLISDRFVLTAGLCSRDLGPITYILVGAFKRSDAADRSKIYKVKNIIRHPEYRPPNRYNDIALIETEETIQLNEFIVPACLPVGDDIDEKRVQVTGWGLTDTNGSDILLRAYLYKMSTSECMQRFRPNRWMNQGFDAQSQTCYEDKIKYQDCQGDSGGPIQVKSKKISCMYNVLGVSSFRKACGVREQPGVYTRVLNYVSWIESIVWPN